MSNEGGGGFMGLLVLITGFLAVVMVGGGLYFAVVKPGIAKHDASITKAEAKAEELKWQTERRAQLDEELSDLKRDVSRFKSKISKAQLAEPSGDEGDDGMGKLRKKLASTADAAEIRTAIERTAEKARVGQTALTVGESSKEGPLTVTPVTLTVSGRYARLTSFLDQLTRVKGRLLLVSQFKLAAKDPILDVFQPAPVDAIDPENPGGILHMRLTVLDYALTSASSGDVKTVRNEPVVSKVWPKIRISVWAFGETGLSGKRDPFHPRMYTQKSGGDSAIPSPPDAAPDEPLDGSATGAIVPQPQPTGGGTGGIGDGTGGVADGETAAGSATGEPVVVVETIDEQLAHDADSYTVMDVSLNVQPAVAILRSPTGKLVSLKLGDKLGNGKGQVVEITETQVTIDEPERAEPIVLPVSD